ncbi:unnamed protein product [Brugia pahangi]|uniref:Alpha-amylase_C domain-containing protein n=1 Tax=Brugia pahangi TaxID=6280 RepID=A0A0N4THS4_BRUPA|nr:unnamed protein product [Brugia pahangi]
MHMVGRKVGKEGSLLELSIETYALALNTDDSEFGGFNRLDKNQHYFTFPEGYAGRRNHLCVYVPCRVAIVLEKVGEKRIS